MIDRRISRRDEPLLTEDLAICQEAFDKIIAELGMDRDGDEAERLAAVILELYREGVHDADKLITLAGTANGRLDTLTAASRETPQTL